MPSKVAIDPEEPSLGRIRADSVAPPHSYASIKRCISRVERTPALARADLFADISCDTPLKEGRVSILRTDLPGLSPNKPMAIVQMPNVQAESSLIPDGRYVIKNRAVNIYWNATNDPITTVAYLKSTTMVNGKGLQVNKHSLFKCSKDNSLSKWDITQDTNGRVFMNSEYARSSWVGAEMTGSKVPVPWRLIPADRNGKFC